MKTKLFFLSSMLLVVVHSHGMNCCGNLGRGIKDIVRVVAMGDGDIKRLSKDQAELIETCEHGCLVGCGLLSSAAFTLTMRNCPPVQPPVPHFIYLGGSLPLGLCCGRIGGVILLACRGELNSEGKGATVLACPEGKED